MKKQIKTFSEKEMLNFVDKLIDSKTYEIIGPKSKGERYVFDKIDNVNEIKLDYDLTILPPKKYFSWENILGLVMLKNYSQTAVVF